MLPFSMPTSNDMHDATRRILAFNEGRNPKMLKHKYKYMRETPFRFYRGACHLFYEDLVKNGKLSASPLAWICGDLHLENFGSFRSANNQVYFDLNDFDEAMLAPALWEVARFLTSLFVGFDSLGIKKEKAIKMTRLFLKSYCNTLKNSKPDYIEAATSAGIIQDFLVAVGTRRQKDLLTKKTFQSKSRLKILLDNPKHFRLDEVFKAELCGHVDAWLKNDDNSPYNYKVIDAIFRLAGTGSVGVDRYAFLLKTLNKTGEKYLLLEMKEAVSSSLLPWLQVEQPPWESEAHRVISVQKRMQNRCPALLSVCEFRGKWYVMEEMQPTRDSINIRLLKDQYRDMYTVIDSMAVLTDSAQLRSAGRKGAARADELIAFGEDTNWQEGVIEYAIQYASLTKSYYDEFVADFTSKGTIGDVIP